MDEVNRELSYKGCRSTIISNPFFTLNGPFQESQELIKYKKRTFMYFIFMSSVLFTTQELPAFREKGNHAELTLWSALPLYCT